MANEQSIADPDVLRECSYLRDVDIARLLKISRATFFRMRRAGKIGPQPVQLFGNTVRYHGTEVSEWLAEKCPDAETWKAMQEAKARREQRLRIAR